MYGCNTEKTNLRFVDEKFIIPIVFFLVVGDLHVFSVMGGRGFSSLLENKVRSALTMVGKTVRISYLDAGSRLSSTLSSPFSAGNSSIFLNSFFFPGTRLHSRNHGLYKTVTQSLKTLTLLHLEALRTIL